MDCIDRIPEKLKDIEMNKKITFSSLLEYMREIKEVKEIVFVASGTSYNSAFTAKNFIENQCGFKVSLCYPNIFLNYTDKLNSDALYVMISQTGTTKLVFECLKKVKALGYKNCAITGYPDSPISKEADASIDMGCGHEEYMYRTIGYSSTVATIYMMSISLAEIYGHITSEDKEKYLEDFRKLFSSLKDIKDISLKWYKDNKFSLMKRDRMILTGTNDLWPVAQEGDIKFMEMVPMMTNSFELEEFIHGPQNCFNDNIIFFVSFRKTEDFEKARSIADFLKKEIGFCAMVGDSALDGRDLSFNPQSQYFSSLEYVTVMQVLAYSLAEDHGRDLKRGVNSQITKYITKTI